MNKQKHPIFNGEWEILQSLGEGNTSKVYLVRNMKDHKTLAALKLLREEFLQRDQDSIKAVEQEIQILQGLKHENIVNIQGWGSDGKVVKPSGREINNLVYIILEYVTGGLLFDVCQTLGGMGEEGGRFFMNQMLDVLEYMHGKGVVHRDLKLENILVDDSMNLKVADFGFATFRKVHNLKSYRGTMTYMAPEIKEGKTYDGMKIDMFSTGVILFIIVQGIFPFKEAKKDEYFYNLLLKGDFDTYWKKTGGQGLSSEFKDLILALFSYDGANRPSVADIRNHPWMAGVSGDSIKQTRSSLIDGLLEKKSQQTADTSAENTCRGDERLHLVRDKSIFIGRKDMNVFDIDNSNTNPGVIWDNLQDFNEDQNAGWTIEEIEGKGFQITKKAVAGDDENLEVSNDASDLRVNVKFYKFPNDKDGNEVPRTILRFNRKSGNAIEWAKQYKDLTDFMSEVLLRHDDGEEEEQQ